MRCAGIIRQIDTSVRQVLIESRIVIASDKFSRQLGVRLGVQTGFTLQQPLRWRLRRHVVDDTGGDLYRHDVYAGDADADAVSSWRPASPTRAIRTRRSSTSICRWPAPRDSLALTLINLGSGNLINLELSALEADTLGKVDLEPARGDGG